MKTHRALVFPVTWQSPLLDGLLREFRLLVNESIRVALKEDINPAWTSKTCPVCGARRRDRVGKVFVRLLCDWEMDRQINAGLNILKTALASNEALARAVRFQPGALRRDVVSPLYDLSALPTGAREEPSGVESQTGVIPSPEP